MMSRWPAAVAGTMCVPAGAIKNGREITSRFTCPSPCPLPQGSRGGGEAILRPFLTDCAEGPSAAKRRKKRGGASVAGGRLEAALELCLVDVLRLDGGRVNGLEPGTLRVARGGLIGLEGYEVHRDRAKCGRRTGKRV